MAPPDMLAVGVVTSTHGITGELKLKSYSGLADHLLVLREALFLRGGQEKRLVLDGVDAKKTEGVEDRDITFPAGDRKITMKGADYLLHFSMPNFYFHVTTAYAILRHIGLEIGKDDFIGQAA